MKAPSLSPLLFATLAVAMCTAVEASGPPPDVETTGAGTPAATTSRAGLEAALLAVAPTLRPEALHAALAARETLSTRGELARDLLGVIDYGLPSTARRLWIFDLATAGLLYHEQVSHGRNTGEDFATTFSNDEGSLMTSLGAFVTGETYVGRNGYSLRLHGMDPGLNDRAEARAIVMHGAPYVSDEFVRRAGRLGRSHGCPAVRLEIARELIDRVKGRSLLYAWHPSMAPRPAPDAVAASASK